MMFSCLYASPDLRTCPALHRPCLSVRIGAQADTTAQVARSLWVHDHKTAFETKGVAWQEPARHVKGKGLCKCSPAEQTNPWYAALSDREKHTLLFWDSFHGKGIGGPRYEFILTLLRPWRELGERPDAGV